MYTENVGEQGYLDLLQHILDNGTDKSDRTGVGTRSIFGAQLRFDLSEGFPLITTKQVWPKGVFAELAWLIRGETNAYALAKDKVHIWDKWADKRTGDLGPIYGKQWREWETGEVDAKGERVVIDQLQGALHEIVNKPDSRRIIVNAWNPSDLGKMALTPCHAMFQFEVHEHKLSCHLYQRSADVFLGVPFNIASYAGLTHVMACLANHFLLRRDPSGMSNLVPGDLIMTFGDVHIYNNLFDQVKEQLTREPRRLPWLEYTQPPLRSSGVPELNNVAWEQFELVGYDPHPAIKGEVAV